MARPLLILWIVALSTLTLKGQMVELAGIQPDSTAIMFDGEFSPGDLSLPASMANMNGLANQFKFEPYLNWQTSFSLSGAPAFSGISWPAYPGLGDFKNYGGTLGQLYNKRRFVVDYGAFISRQSGYSFSSMQVGVGTNVLLKYQMTNRLQFFVLGQYFQTKENKDPILQQPFLFNRSTIGCGFQYKPDERSKIQISVEYQYDPAAKSWKAESGGKAEIKF